MGDTRWEKDQSEVVWAMLNGDWSLGMYRYELANAGKCLLTLRNDDYMIIRRVAEAKIKELHVI